MSPTDDFRAGGAGFPGYSIGTVGVSAFTVFNGDTFR